MKRKAHFVFGLLRVITDLCTINFSFIFSFWVRFKSGLIPMVHGSPEITAYIRSLPIISALLLFIMRSFGLYAVEPRLSVVDEFFAIVKSMTMGLMLFMAATFIYRDFTYSRMMLFVSWIGLMLFVFCGRFFLNRLRLWIRAANKDFSNLILVGTGPTAIRLIRHIGNDPHWNYKIIGAITVSDETKEADIEGIPVLGTLEMASDILSRRNIDEVILTVPSLSREKVMSLILECEKRMITFRLIADLLGMITSKVDMENIDGIPLLGLKESPLVIGYNRFVKRAIDIIGSLTGLILLSPLFIIISSAVKFTSRGPVFYLQKRIGEDGRRFAILKFRTMRDKAEKGIGPVWAKKDDPRRTRIGIFLRRHNLDEIPQLINVLRGDMSLVGPRPERPRFVGRFKEYIPRYMARHKIRSGITGWAQVNGLRGDTSIDERTKYDIYYIENWSLLFDIKILLISVFQTLFSKPEHAY